MERKNEPVEQSVLSNIADDYIQRGYSVVIEPAPREGPNFLKKYPLDMIAKKGTESVVIEVKTLGRARDSRILREVSEAIRRHPNWRLQVVIADRPDPWDSQFKTPSVDEIKDRMEAAARMYNAGDQIPAFLLLWSLLEAAARHRLREVGVKRAMPRTPIALLKDLVSFGYLEQDEYDRLAEIAHMRNAAAHGFLTLSVDQGQFQHLKSLVESLLKTSEPVG